LLLCNDDHFLIKVGLMVEVNYGALKRSLRVISIVQNWHR